MRISAVSAINEMPHGTKLEAIRGTIKKVHPIKTGTNSHGDWSMQNLLFFDNTGEITIVLKDRAELTKEWAGCMVLITAGEHGKKPIGIEAEDNEYNSVVTRRIKVTPSATIEDGREIADTQQQPPQTQQQQRPKQAPPSQRAAPPPNYAEEERTEQRQTAPAPQQQRPAPGPQSPPAGSTPSAADRVTAVRKTVFSLVTLYSIAHDAAVYHAASVFQRHGHVMPPEAVGALATTLFIESNKQGALCPALDLEKLPAPHYRLADILAQGQPIEAMPEKQW